jgi:hypothetical protein
MKDINAYRAEIIIRDSLHGAKDLADTVLRTKAPVLTGLLKYGIPVNNLLIPIELHKKACEHLLLIADEHLQFVPEDEVFTYKADIRATRELITGKLAQLYNDSTNIDMGGIQQ